MGSLLFYKYKVALFSLLTFISASCLSVSSEDVDYELTRAQYFVRSNPKQSQAILNQIKNINSLSDEQKVAFYTLKMRTSLILNKLEAVEPHLDSLFALDDKSAFADKLVTILSGSGIWLRKSNYFDAAQQVFSCALKHTEKSGQRISILISSAIVARHQQNYAIAISLYNQAAAIAKKLDNLRAIATIENNLGAIAMDQGDIKQAELHFRQALSGFQRTNNHSGHINSGINLLFTFIIQNQDINYQRLYPHISKLSDEYPDNSKKAYLFWVDSTYTHSQGYKLPTTVKDNLYSSFDKLAGPQLQALIRTYLATRLDIQLPPVTFAKARLFENKSWYTKVLNCNW